MKKLLMLLSIITFPVISVIGQNKISHYEYWFDNDYIGKKVINVTPTTILDLNTSITTYSLNTGLHTFHIRFCDKNNRYSNTLSQFFQKIPVSNTKKIVAYEYWFDNNYTARISQTVTPQSTIILASNLPTMALLPGLHIFHIRFMDDDGIWSSMQSQFFHKITEGNSANNNITACEYWFDNDYAGKVYQTVTAQNQLQFLASIEAQALSNGLHIFHVRFKDTKNTWSTTISSFFQKVRQENTTPNFITKYRYWFDSADSIMHETALVTPENLYNLNTLLDLTSICKGNHTIHFQFKDTLKNWSCVTTDTIYKYPEVVAAFTPNIELVCDSGNVQFSNLSFDADTFKWVFDDNSTSNLPNPVHYFSTYGNHPVKLIAMDTTKGEKDSITIDIQVVQSPIVHLGEDTSVCPPGITLNAWNAGCDYLWSNALSDSLIHVIAPGSYYVTVTNVWGCLAFDTINIHFNPAPAIDLGNDTAICIGKNILIDAGPEHIAYHWNTGETSQTITVSTADTFFVEVTDTNGCSNTDTIHIALDPCAGIKEFNDYHFKIFPNPNNGQYFIESLSDIPESVNISITDLTGRKIYEQRYSTLSRDEVLPVNNENFDNGVYLLIIQSKTFNNVSRIVITH